MKNVMETRFVEWMMYQQHGGTLLNVCNIKVTGYHRTVLCWKGLPVSSSSRDQGKFEQTRLPMAVSS